MDIREIENEIKEIDSGYATASDVAIYANNAIARLQEADENDDIAIAVAQEAIKNLTDYLGIEDQSYNIESYSVGYQYKLTLEGLGDIAKGIGNALAAVWDAIWGAIMKVFNWFGGLFGGFDKKNKELQKWVSEMTDEQKTNCTNLLEKMKNIAKGLRQAGTDKYNADANSIPSVNVDIAEYTIAYDPAYLKENLDRFENVVKELTGKSNEYLALANDADFIGKIQSGIQGIIKCDQIPQPYNTGLLQNYIKNELKANPATTLMLPTLETGKGVGIVFLYAGKPVATTDQNNNNGTPATNQQSYNSESYFNYLGESYNFEDGLPGIPTGGNNSGGNTGGDNGGNNNGSNNAPADNNQNNNQNNQQQVSKFTTAFHMFDSIGPYSAITTDISSLREHSVETVIEHINKLGDWDKAMKDHTDRIKKMGENLDKEMKKTVMPDTYKNQVINKGIGNGMKSLSVELCNMITRRRSAIEKIVKATLPIPGNENQNNQQGETVDLGPIPTEQDGKDKVNEYIKKMIKIQVDAGKAGKNAKLNISDADAENLMVTYFKLGGTIDGYLAIVKEAGMNFTAEQEKSAREDLEKQLKKAQEGDNSGTQNNQGGNTQPTQPQPANNAKGGKNNKNTGSFTNGNQKTKGKK